MSFPDNVIFFYNKVINKTFGQKYSILEKLLHKFNEEHDPPEILFLGDSTVVRGSYLDDDRRSIPEMLQGLLGKEIKVLSLAKGAYHTGIFYHLINMLNRTLNKPRLIILPINMRSFSPQWHLCPKYQFLSEIEHLKRNYKNNSSNLRCKIKKYRMPFHEIQVEYPMTTFRTVGEFEECLKSKPNEYYLQIERRKQLSIYFYLHKLTSNHPKLESLKDILKLVRKLDIKILLYITPVNYLAAGKNVGKNFHKHFSYNLSILKTMLKNENVLIIDNESFGEEEFRNTFKVCTDFANSLGREYFFHAEFLNEHLNEKGRTFLAEHISGITSNILKNI